MKFEALIVDLHVVELEDSARQAPRAWTQNWSRNAHHDRDFSPSTLLPGSAGSKHDVHEHTSKRVRYAIREYIECHLFLCAEYMKRKEKCSSPNTTEVHLGHRSG